MSGSAQTGAAPGALAELMAMRDGPTPPGGEAEVVAGPPLLPSRFLLGETNAAILQAIGTLATDLNEMKGGRRAPFRVARRRVEATVIADRIARLRGPDGAEVPAPEPPWMEPMRRMTQPWPTADGYYFLPHLNLPHLRDRVCAVLGAEPTPDSVAAGVARRGAEELDAAIAAARACGAPVRSAQGWLRHPQGTALAALPAVRLTRIGNAPAEPAGHGPRILSGVRVLDLTRILAGPIVGRTLAEQGADVLMVTAPHLPQAEQHVRDTSHGKRSAFIDLDTAEGAARLRALVAGADVFSQGYRPGTLSARGFGPGDLAALRPGIICVSISCYGPGGPLSGRAGWEQVAQAATGIAAANGGDGPPKLIPVPACDYMTGFLGAYGALLALRRRAVEGGSWHVEVSLAQAAMLLLRQGVLPEERPTTPLTEDERAGWCQDSDTAYGRLSHLSPALEMPATPVVYDRPTPVLGADAPTWLET